MQKPKVLYIDDDETNVLAFHANFRGDFDVVAVTSVTDALKELDKQEFHVIISDQRMPFVLGTEFLEGIHIKCPHTIKVILTAYQDFNVALSALNSGNIYRILLKPWNNEEVIQTVMQGYELFMLRREKDMLIDELFKSQEQLKSLVSENLKDLKSNGKNSN